MLKYLVFAVSFWGASALAEDLSAGQIKEQLIGQSIAWWDANGWMMGNMVLSPNGKAEITLERPEAAHDAGQWKLEGNQICTVWASMRDGMPKCYSVRQTSPGHFVTSGGNEFAIRSVGV